MQATLRSKVNDLCRVVAHLRTTWRPIGPSLAATGALLRQGGGRAFILGAACFLAAMAAAVVAEDVFAQSTYNILKHGVDVLSSHPLDEINRDIARALAISELIEAPVLSLAIIGPRAEVAPACAP